MSYDYEISPDIIIDADKIEDLVAKRKLNSVFALSPEDIGLGYGEIEYDVNGRPLIRILKFTAKGARSMDDLVKYVVAASTYISDNTYEVADESGNCAEIIIENGAVTNVYRFSR